MLITIVGLSISHTRALMAQKALGTKFSEVYIPIVNPTQITKDLFSKSN